MNFYLEPHQTETGSPLFVKMLLSKLQIIRELWRNCRTENLALKTMISYFNLSKNKVTLLSIDF